MARRVHESIVVQAPVEGIFRYWSNFKHFATFMHNVEEVRMTDQTRSRWRVKGPSGKSVEFDAKTTGMDQNRSISWNTTEGEFMTSGAVRFEKITDWRTRIEVTINYADLPGGQVGETVANDRLDPEWTLKVNLRTFKRRYEKRIALNVDLGRPTLDGGPSAHDPDPS